MEDSINFLKVLIAGAITYVSVKLGVLAPLLSFLTLAMIMDYVSGLISAAQNGQLSSKKGLKGILKKVCYVFVIAAALITDELIVIIGSQFYDMPKVTIFGMLTIVWLTLNELLSILENINRMGLPLPNFLKKAIKMLKENVDKKGDNEKL